jgi:O-antigen/teichoic acid export membrane protein
MNKLASNILFLISEKILIIIINLASNIFVIRYLGVEYFGKLAIFQVYYALLIAISEFGLRRIYSSLTSISREKLLFRQCFKIKVFTASLLGGALLCVLVLSSGTDYYYYFLLLAVIASPFELFVYHFEANLQNQLLVKIRVSLSISLAVLRVVLCLIHADFYLIVFTFAINNLLINFICSYLVSKKISLAVPIKSKYFRKIVSTHIFERSFFFWISMIIVQVNMRTDQLLLSNIASITEVGIYAGAYKLVEQLMMIPSILSSVFLPYISKNKNINKTEYLKRLYASTLALSIPICAIAILLAPYILPMLLGKSFIQSVSVFQILCIAFPFLALANLSGLYYSLNMLERYAVYRNFLGLISSIILNYFFISSMGSEGAALSVLISYFLMTFVYELFLKKTQGNAILKINSVKLLFTVSFYKDLLSIVKAKRKV